MIPIACEECGCEELIREDEVTFCGLCGLITEINPGWAITHIDIHNIRQVQIDEKTGLIERQWNEPRQNDYGYQRYKEHSFDLLRKLNKG